MLFLKSTIFNCHLKCNFCLIYLHFVSDSQKYLCLQVNGLRELGSLKLIQMQGKVIWVLILFDCLQRELFWVDWVACFFIFLSLSAVYNRITEKNQTANRYTVESPVAPDHLVYATTSPQRPVFQNTKSQITSFTTSCKRPPLVSYHDHF